MNELLAGARGELLAYDDYVASVERDYQHVGRQGFWKLERRQSFQEPTSPSWEYEHHGQLAEMITLGVEVMYDINYDQDGLQEGGTRIDDHEVAARCRRLIAKLYDKGEDFETFYQREIAPLAPPVR